MADHLNPGGLLILERWLLPETYQQGKLVADFIDEPELKAARIYQQQRIADRSVFDIQYIGGSTAGVWQCFERHELGLFSDMQYRNALESAGLEVQSRESGLFAYGLLIGHKPA
jgi:hypothetical protein